MAWGYTWPFPQLIAMSAKIISVLLVDDHPMIIAGMQKMLATTDDIRAIAQAGCASGAMDEVARQCVDVALIDINLPGESGLSLLQRIKRTSPHIAVIIISTYGEELYALRALHAGADGYVNKGTPMKDLLGAIRKVAQGGKYFSAFMNELLVKQVQTGGLKNHAELTAREFEIMMRLVAGDSTGTIAAHLNRSPKTISTHRSRLFEKLNIKSNAQLTRYAMEQGLIAIPMIKK